MGRVQRGRSDRGTIRLAWALAWLSAAASACSGPRFAGNYPSEGAGDAGADASARLGFDTNPAAAPTCRITSPVLGDSHVALNGMPAAQGGDRTSAPGAPYTVAFEVTTSVPNDQSVELDVSDGATPPHVATYTAKATNGKATFPAVPLADGGVYEISARCLDADGDVGLASPVTYPVDAKPPTLTIVGPNAGEAIPLSGLTDGAFPVCVKTSSPDAVNLPASLGASMANFCAGTNGRPTCTTVLATGDEACVNLPCPGDAPFEIMISLADAAGNAEQTTLEGVTCSSTLPAVQIVTPDSDAPPFADVSKRLLAATASQPLHDLAATTAGAQSDVVACASRKGTMTLLAGLAGDALAPLGAAVATRAATTADGCPAGLPFVATFAGATLPESAEDALTKLVTPTELRADFADLSGTKNSSPVVHLWVDSIAPVLQLVSPTDICGSVHAPDAATSSGTFTTDEAVTSTAPIVTLTLTTDDFTENFASTTFMSMTFSVVFPPGATEQSGTARDAAGNVSALEPAPCTVTVGPEMH